MSDEQIRKERRKEVRGTQDPDGDPVDERRRFTRVALSGHLDVMVCTDHPARENGMIENLSRFGVLVRLAEAPDPGTVVLVRWQEEKIGFFINTDDLVLEDTGEVIGTVVRVSPCADAAEYDVAIKFLKKGL